MTLKENYNKEQKELDKHIKALWQDFLKLASQLALNTLLLM